MRDDWSYDGGFLAIFRLLGKVTSMDYLFTFLEGIASFVSPCLLPMIPIYIGYFIGENEKDSKRAVVNSIGFVLGFTVVFVLLSIFASTLRWFD